MIEKRICPSFSEYIKETMGLYKKCNSEKEETLIFRGHGKTNYLLLPGCFRGMNSNEYSDSHKLEIEYPEEFDKKDHLSCLVKMQHYGLKTRLLDFTRNCLVALYFACCLNPLDDGEVLVFQISNEDVKHHSSDTILCLSCLPFIKPFDQNELLSFCIVRKGEKLTGVDYKHNEAVHHLYHEIRSQYPTFDFEIKTNDLLTSFFVAANKDNERMKRQDGLFAIFGLDKEESKRKLESYLQYELIIPANKKKVMLESLEHLGIDDSVVYPSLDRAAAQIYGRQYVSQKILSK